VGWMVGATKDWARESSQTTPNVGAWMLFRTNGWERNDHVLSSMFSLRRSTVSVLWRGESRPFVFGYTLRYQGIR
jgi:hypothetical protein